MSLENCINNAVAGGEMDPKRAAQVVAQFQSLFVQFQNTMGPTQAQHAAAQQVMANVRAAAAQKRRVHQLQAAASQRLLQRMQAHRNIKGQRSPADFVQDLISNKRGAQGQSLSGAYEAVRRGFKRELLEAMTAFRANVVGVRRNQETLRNMTREIFGENTGDAAAQSMAQAWAAVAEKARTRFNAAGGHIGKRSDWGLPQMHDATAVRRATYDDWKAEILPRLDLAAMGRDFNNGVPFTPETIELLLDDAYQAIRTDGYSRRSPSARHGSAMYNSRADHRFFKFKSADDWLAYNEKFGAGQDAFRVMMGHLDGMALDISMMEQLGPNPLHTYQFLKDAAMGEAQRSSDLKAPEQAQSKLDQADNMFDLFTGRTNIQGNASFAKGASAVRQYLTSTHLGSALFSSVTDFNTQRLAASFVGMNQLGFMRQLGRLVADGDFRAEAHSAGLIFENAINMGNAVARYNLEEMHIETAARMADFTIRASGLGYVTEIQRQAFGLEFMSTMAKKWRSSSWADLDPKAKRVFQHYGFTAREWGIVQAAPTHTAGNGLEILRAQEIEDFGHQDVADLYMEAVTSLTEFAVPSTDLYGRAALLGRAKAGTVGGELLRSFMQFKAFPVTILTTQVSRMLSEAYAGRKLGAASYAANLFIGATIFGAAAMQMKEVAKGKDPQDMTSAKFWIAAMAQGGGLGIFGDFLFGDVNRFGGGLAETVAGPSVGFASDLLKFSVGNVQQAVKGEETRVGREFVGLLRRYTPGGSLWYARLAYEREILDQLQMVLDPEARSSFRARERQTKATGNTYFAPPGSHLLGSRSRLPDLANAFGG